MAKFVSIGLFCAVADMSKPVDVAAIESQLGKLRNIELREEWRRLYQTPPPRRLSRDLMIRGITYKIQERTFGGLSKFDIGKLVKHTGKTNSGNANFSKPKVSLKPETRLVREWSGVTHTVVVLSDGIEWRGKRYRSLSIVAREITGAHWSGPRFFGLSGRRQVADA